MNNYKKALILYNSIRIPFLIIGIPFRLISIICNFITSRMNMIYVPFGEYLIKKYKL